jgi:hypothetical protein
MRRTVMLAMTILVLGMMSALGVEARAETSVTAAGEGPFPPGVSYLGVPLSSLTVGSGLSVSGTWALGQFQTTLVGLTVAGPREITIEGLASSSVPSGPNAAIFSGTCTVDPGDGTPPVSGVPFTVVLGANPDGTGSLALTLGATSLPSAAVNEGYVTIRPLEE